MTFLPQLKEQLVSSSPTTAPAPPHPLPGRRAGAAAGGRGGRARRHRRDRDRLEGGAAGALSGEAGHRPRAWRSCRSAHLLPLRVPDPAGGPPWGLRLVTTSRGLTCVEAGPRRRRQAGRARPGRHRPRRRALPRAVAALRDALPRLRPSRRGCRRRGWEYLRRGRYQGPRQRRGAHAAAAWGPGEDAPGQPPLPRRRPPPLPVRAAGPRCRADRLPRTGTGSVAGGHSARRRLPDRAGRAAASRRRHGRLLPRPSDIRSRGSPTATGPCARPRGSTGRAGQCQPRAFRSPLAGLDPAALRRPLHVRLTGRRLLVSFTAPVGVARREAVLRDHGALREQLPTHLLRPLDKSRRPPRRARRARAEASAALPRRDPGDRQADRQPRRPGARPRPRGVGLQHHGWTLQGGRPCRGLGAFRGPLTARPS